MTRITLSTDLAHQVANATDTIVFCDPAGNILVSVPPPNGDDEALRSKWTTEEIAKAKRSLASNQPRYTTAEVLEHLRNLEGQCNDSP